MEQAGPAQFCIHQVEVANYSIPQLSTDYITYNQNITLCLCRSAINVSVDVPIFCMVCKGPYLQKTVFKCSRNHYICSACHHFNLVTCERDGTPFVEATTEVQLLNNFKYVCKWGCGGIDRFEYLDCHQVECTSQPIRKCPVVDCPFVGTLRKIFNHYQQDHSFRNIKMYDYWLDTNRVDHGTSGVYVLYLNQENRQWHYLASNKFVQIDCLESEQGYQFTLRVCEDTNDNEKEKIKMRCCALVKYEGQPGYKVTDTFTVPKTVTEVGIRVFFE